MSAVLTKTVGQNVLSGYVTFIARMATAFFLTPFVIRSIGVSDYGLWLLVLSVTGYFYLFDFGFGQAIVRYIAMKRATNERQALNELVSTFLLIYGAIGLVIAVITVVLATIFPWLFHVAPGQEEISRFMLVVTGFSAALSFPLSVFGGLLHGYQRYDLTRSVGLVVTVVNAVLTVLVLVWGSGLLGLVLLAAATALASGLAQLVIARWIDPDLKVGIKRFRMSRLREVTSYSIYFFVHSVALQICLRSDQIVIGLFLPIVAVAIYGVNLRLVEIARSLAGQLNQVLFPLLAGLHALSDQTQLQRVLIEGTRISLGLMIAVASQLVILGSPFIRKWVGPEFLAGYPALVILAAVAVMAIGQDIASKILLVSDGQRLVATVSVFDAVVNIVLSVSLVQRLGIVGVALGTAIPFSVVAIVEVWVACRRLDLSVGRFVWKSFVPATLSATPAALLLWGLSEWSYPSTWWEIIWQSSLGLAVNAVGFVIMCLPAGSHASVVKLVQRRMET